MEKEPKLVAEITSSGLLIRDKEAERTLEVVRTLQFDLSDETRPPRGWIYANTATGQKVRFRDERDQFGKLWPSNKYEDAWRVEVHSWGVYTHSETMVYADLLKALLSSAPEPSIVEIYIHKLKEHLQARSQGDEVAEETLLDELDKIWAALSDEQIKLVNLIKINDQADTEKPS